jgi:hypothetical protein
MKRFLGAALVSFLLLGCIRMKQQVRLLPDGSGKLTFTVSLREEDDADPFEGLVDPDELEQTFLGIVAWIDPVREEKDGWHTITMSGYFEDIGKVQVVETTRDNEKMFGFRLTRDENGSTLVLTEKLHTELERATGINRPEPEGDFEKQMAKQLKEMLKEAIQGMRFELAVSAPGPIEEAEGLFEKDGRTAKLRIEEDLITGGVDGKEEAVKKLKTLTGKYRITWKKEDLPAEEIEAFKKESAAAKEAWPALREKWVKEAQEQKKKEEKGR